MLKQALRSVPKQSARQLASARAASTLSNSVGQMKTQSHLVAGVAGGAVVFAGGYVFYHLSGAKTAIATLHATKKAVDAAKQKLTDSASTMGDNFDYNTVKPLVKTFAASIPGGAWMVDQLFVKIDEIRKDHGKEIDTIVKDLWKEIKSDKSLTDIVPAVMAKLEALPKIGKQISSAAQEKVQVSLNDFVADHPELKNLIQSGLQKLQNAGDSKVLAETVQQMKDIATNGVNSEAVEKMKKLVEQKVGSLSNEAESMVQEFLSKNQSLKTAISEPLEQLRSSGSAELIQDTWSDLSKLASKGLNKDSISEAKKILEKRLKQAKESGAKILEQYPELEKIMNPEVLKKIGSERGQELIKEVSALLRNDGVNAKTLKKVKEIVETEVSKTQKDLKK